jgi:hypothetical protein
MNGYDYYGICLKVETISKPVRTTGITVYIQIMKGAGIAIKLWIYIQETHGLNLVQLIHYPDIFHTFLSTCRTILCKHALKTYGCEGTAPCSHMGTRQI